MGDSDDLVDRSSLSGQKRTHRSKRKFVPFAREPCVAARSLSPASESSCPQLQQGASPVIAPRL